MMDGTERVSGGTRECYGAVLLVARELKFAESLCDTHGDGAAREYRRLRPKGLTRSGLAHWAARCVFGGVFGRALPSTFTEDVDVAHPDFDAPW